MRIKRIMILIACISVLSACAANAATKKTESSNPEIKKDTMNNGLSFSPIAHAQTAELLEFIRSYSESNKATQKQTYLKVMQALASDKDNLKLNIKHAAILAIPNSSLRDTLAAQQHLRALLANPKLSKSNNNLVQLLHTFTLDHHAESKKRRESTKKIETLKQKNKVLTQKLNGLKNIEKTMIKRNTTSNN